MVDLMRLLTEAADQTQMPLGPQRAAVLAHQIGRNLTREAHANAAYFHMNPRLADTLHALAAGETAPETAARLGVSVETVRTRRKELYRRLGAATGAQAVEIGCRMGLVPQLDVLPARPVVQDGEAS